MRKRRTMRQARTPEHPHRHFYGGHDEFHAYAPLAEDLHEECEAGGSVCTRCDREC